MSVPRDDLAGLAAAEARLLDDLADLSDTEAAAPSLLPGWTVGHVVTHLTRNADGFIRMAMAATRGEVAHQYPGGADQRAADIEAGATRPAAEMVEDLRRSIEDLTSAFARLGPEAWSDGVGMAMSGPRPVVELPFRRWREVEMHHVDLGRSSFRVGDWSEAYVERELAETLAALPSRLPEGVALRIDFEDAPDVVTVGDGEVVVVSGSRRWVLGWLSGRLEPPSELPPLEPWL
ncbi:MAG: maleylpyruvate isomerase family mycothiol-dependent enzyme [Acidimicrobiales bacterium]|nr:maleylpyruvate isomerase family mycothiol-dependent enzyme [Acidimicrobiales bacterium]